MKKSAITAGLCAATMSTALVLPATAVAAPTAQPTTPPATQPSAPAAQPTGHELQGKTVFLDPGHQAAADGHDLNKQVPDGRGGTKACQTTGMTTIDGVPEHTINWDVEQLVKAGLGALGANVVQSRQNDTGWGGCIDERAAAANASHANLAVSIHADSTSNGVDNKNHGFHLIVPTLPIPDTKANAAQSGPGRKASDIMRDAYVKAGYTPANYAGVKDGIQTRSDIAGPALTEVPLVFIEMGNGSNPADAKALESKDGQLKQAGTIITGIVNYLMSAGGNAAAPAAAGAAPTTTAPAPSTGATTADGTSTTTPTTTGAAPMTAPTTTITPTTTTAPPAAPNGLTNADAQVSPTDPNSTGTDTRSAQYSKLISDAIAVVQEVISGHGTDALQAMLANPKSGDIVAGLISALLQVISPAMNIHLPVTN